MAEKDITEKRLINYNDVFADIVNVLLFGGKRLVDENDLTSDTTSTYYKSGKKLSEQDRDVSKIWKNNNIRVALLGVENQTQIEKDMPLRIIGYDGASYRDQLSMKLSSSQKNNYPVVTMVLYFGSRRWNKNLSLHEVLEISEELKPFVSDYKINVFEIAYLTDEQISMFKSDFKFIADYFAQIRKTGYYKPMPKDVVHYWETFNMMTALTHDNRFEEAAYELKTQGKESVNMCEFLDRIENRGIAKGRAEGISVGRAEGISVGRAEGISVGRAEGISVGRAEGISVGRAEGISVGRAQERKAGKINNVIRIYNKLGDIAQVAFLLDTTEEEVSEILAQAGPEANS